MGNKAVLEPTKSATYNAKAEQNIKLEFTKGSKTFIVSHLLKSLSDGRFLQFDKVVEKKAQKVLQFDTNGVSLDTLLASEKETLWDELALGRTGYKESSEWKTTTHLFHKISAIDALLLAKPFFPITEQSEDDLLSDDEVTEINLRAVFDGQEVITKHFFRTETKKELDEYLAILSKLPQKNALASASKSKSERYVELYNSLCQTVIGYENDEVPAWHKIEVVIFYFEQTLKNLGKF